MDQLIDRLSLVFVAFFDEDQFGLKASFNTEKNMRKNGKIHLFSNEKNVEMKPIKRDRKENIQKVLT